MLDACTNCGWAPHVTLGGHEDQAQTRTPRSTDLGKGSATWWYPHTVRVDRRIRGGGFCKSFDLHSAPCSKFESIRFNKVSLSLLVQRATTTTAGVLTPSFYSRTPRIAVHLKGGSASTYVMCGDGTLRLGLTHSYYGGTPEAARRTANTLTRWSRAGGGEVQA